MIEFLQISRKDISILALLHGSCFERGWSADTFDRLLASPGTVAFLARSDAEEVGFVLARVVADEAEILSLGVSASSRRNGIAARILTIAAEHAFLAGAARLFLEVGAENAAAQALYRKLGFGVVGRRKDYYQNGSGDGLTMRADLPLCGLGNAPELD